MYFNVNFNVFFKLIKVHLLMSELYKDCPSSEKRNLMEKYGQCFIHL